MKKTISNPFVTWHLVLLFSCVVTLFLSVYMKPTQFLYEKSPVDIDLTIPKEFGGWKLDAQVSPIIQSEEQKKTLDKIYSQIINRVYTDRFGYKMMLSIAYTNSQSDNSGQQSHLPEICYPAQGFSVLKKEQSEKNVLHGRKLLITKLVAEADKRHEPLTYWTTVGSYSVNSMFTMKKAQFSYAIKGIIPDGMIFRVSSIDADDENAFKKQNVFIDDLFSVLTEKEQTRFGLYEHN